MAAKANITIDQGSDWSTTIDVTDDNGVPINLTGYTGAGQIRKYYTSSTAVDFDVVITANTGEVVLSLDANTTNNMADGRYVYDVELTDSSNTVSRLVEGIATVTPGVTR